MKHEPDPLFVERLEWQVCTAVRRRERFALPVSGSDLRWLRTAALVLVSLLGGAGAVLAAERLQDSLQKEFLLARGRIEMEMVELQLRHAADSLESMRRLSEQGVISSREVVEARAQLERHGFDLEDKRLDLEEISVTGTEPNRDLSAPPAGGRDYVTSHLKIELERTESELSRARELLERSVQAQQAGVAGEREVSEAREAMSAPEEELQWCQQRLRIRADFLAGRHTAEEVWLLVMRAEKRKDLRVTEKRLALLLGRHELNKLLEQSGRASGVARQSGLELRLLEAELQLLRLELARIAELMKD